MVDGGFPSTSHLIWSRPCSVVTYVPLMTYVPLKFDVITLLSKTIKIRDAIQAQAHKKTFNITSKSM
jgi:hypothetical protein